MVTSAKPNLYAPPKSSVADVASDADSELSSRGARLGAVMLDGLIFGVPFIPCYVAAFSAVIRSKSTNVAGNPFAIWAVMARSGPWFYVGVLAAVATLTITTILVKRNGQTIGKKLLGIKVVRKDGSKAGLGRIFWLRYLLNSVFMLIPVLGGLYSLVDSLFIFGSTRRCVHDYLADTIVVRA